jgi:FlaA1/EpsC-like NDP-sugar epimerase
MPTALLSETELALGRPEQPLSTDAARLALAKERILITGAYGSIGSALGLDTLAYATDLHDLNVERDDGVKPILDYRPSLILHLAGVKYAPLGEEDPADCIHVNALGTMRVVEVAQTVGARVVTASTCKAANPETCYGATKLLAERLTLNAGGTVVRFYNVIETAGNVFELWRNMTPDEPIRWTPCTRYFMSRAEAVSLLLNAAVLPSGRYAFDARPARQMVHVARDLYPERERLQIAARRGDRLIEPFRGERENVTRLGHRLLRIRNPHD